MRALALLLIACALPAAGRVRAVHPPHPRILWIGAHPDDEILVAPILGRECVERGAQCALLVMTEGEAGGAAAVRTAEMQRAAALFRASLTQWTFADVMGDVGAAWSAAAGGREALVARLAAEIRAIAPETVYTFDPHHGTTCHPAHRALGQLVLDAIATLPAQPRVVVVETAAAFEGNDFAFRAATDSAVVVDAAAEWTFVVRDAEIHASQFSPEQVASLAAAPPRVWLLDAGELPRAVYSVACP